MGRDTKGPPKELLLKFSHSYSSDANTDRQRDEDTRNSNILHSILIHIKKYIICRIDPLLIILKKNGKTCSISQLIT